MTDRPTLRRARFGAAAVATVVALSAAGIAGAADPEQSPSEVTAWKVPRAQVRAAVRDLDGIVRSVQRRSGVPGISVAVVSRDRVVASRGFGTTNTNDGRRVRPNTVFELASLSKSVGATVVARAAGQGTVAWTDPVVEHLPDFALSDPYVTEHVTVEDMYAHRSGLPNHAGDLLEDLGYPRDEVLQRLRYLPLRPFRAVYNYTNFGLTAAAESVANAAGMPWEDLSRSLLYEPLGMQDTSSRFSDYAAHPDRADLHVKVGKRWQPEFVRNADAQSPAGGVSSSARDLAKWMRMVLANGRFDGERILRRSQILELRTPRMTTRQSSATARPSQYSLGFNVSVDETGRLRLGHSGAFALGAGTAFAMSPAEQLGIVVLTNGMPIGAAEAIVGEFMERALVGDTSRDWYATYSGLFAQLLDHPTALGDRRPGQPEAPQPNAAYVGTYDSDYYGPLTIVERDGGLVLQLGPEPMEFALEPWTGNTFAYETVGENASGRQAVRFRGNRGQATSVTVANLHDPFGRGSDVGVFTR